MNDDSTYLVIVKNRKPQNEKLYELILEIFDISDESIFTETTKNRNTQNKRKLNVRLLHDMYKFISKYDINKNEVLKINMENLNTLQECNNLLKKTETKRMISEAEDDISNDCIVQTNEYFEDDDSDNGQSKEENRASRQLLDSYFYKLKSM